MYFQFLKTARVRLTATFSPICGVASGVGHQVEERKRAAMLIGPHALIHILVAPAVVLFTLHQINSDVACDLAAVLVDYFGDREQRVPAAIPLERPALPVFRFPFSRQFLDQLTASLALRE